MSKVRIKGRIGHLLKVITPSSIPDVFSLPKKACFGIITARIDSFCQGTQAKKPGNTCIYAVDIMILSI
jgi:hypothetical protein